LPAKGALAGKGQVGKGRAADRGPGGQRGTPLWWVWVWTLHCWPKPVRHNKYFRTTGLKIFSEKKDNTNPITRSETKMISEKKKSKNAMIFEGPNACHDALAAAQMLVKLTQEHTPPGTRFADYSRRVLAKATDLKQSTRQMYSSVLETHILPSGEFNIEMGSITRGRIKAFLHNLVTTKSKGTAELAYVILCRVLDEAINDGLIAFNCARNLHKRVCKEDKEDRPKFKPNPFSVQERDHFLSVASIHCHRSLFVLFNILCFSGMRLAEAQALRVKCFDFDNLSVHITEQYIKDKLVHRFEGFRLSSRRTVQLADFLMDTVKSHITLNRLQDADLLFVDPFEKQGLPFSQRKIAYTFKKVCKKAGLKPRRIHDLRHTYAICLLLAHRRASFVRDQLGHASIKTTIDIYSPWICGPRVA
jgi:integrase